MLMSTQLGGDPLVDGGQSLIARYPESRKAVPGKVGVWGQGKAGGSHRPEA
jgi:hypothetical protein